MKANELRIGNRIKYSSFEGIKKELRDSYVIVDGDVLRFLSNFKTEFGVELWYLPIELTEEILLKCGFKEIKKGVFKLNDWYIDLFSNTWKFKREYQDICFKYLHQLQNIYFALTNEELEINL